MSDINASFTRAVMVDAHAAVKRQFPAINLRQASVLKTWGGVRPQWLFEYMHQGKRWTWEGTAYNAAEARAKGWDSFLRTFGQAEE